MLPVERETCLITLPNLSGFCFKLLHLVTLLMALQPPLKSTEDTRMLFAGSGNALSCIKSTQKNKGFGILIYIENLPSLSGSKNWTQNVQPSPWLDEGAVKCFSGARLGESPIYLQECKESCGQGRLQTCSGICQNINSLILNKQLSTSAGHKTRSPLVLQKLHYLTSSWAPEIQPDDGWLAGPLRLSLLHRTWQHCGGWTTSRWGTSLCLPHPARWGQKVLPTLKQGPKHGWWVQKWTFWALQLQKFGHGEEKHLAIVLPAPAFQLWPLGWKASAK